MKILLLALGMLAIVGIHDAQAQRPAEPQGVDPYHVIGRYAAEATTLSEQIAAVRQQAQAIAEREAATKAWWAAWWEGMYPRTAPSGAGSK